MKITITNNYHLLLDLLDNTYQQQLVLMTGVSYEKMKEVVENNADGHLTKHWDAPNFEDDEEEFELALSQYDEYKSEGDI